MDKRELVRKAFEKGILLSPETLGKLDEKSLEEAIKDARSSGRVVAAGQEPHKPQITVKMRRLKSKKTITPRDVAEFY